MRFQILFFLLFLYSGHLISQGMILTPEAILNNMERKIATVESFQYTTSFEFKEFGREKPEKKRFTIFAQRNTNNVNYYFDWRIDEEDSPLTHLFVDNDFYYLNREQKWVTIYKDFGQPGGEGSYSEFIRLTNLFDEILLKKKYITEGTNIKHSEKYLAEDFWVIEFEVDGSTQAIWINKTTFFPEKRMWILEHKNLKQTITTEIMNLKLVPTFSQDKFDTNFSENGFSEKFIYKSESNENEIFTDFELYLNKKQVDSLLNFSLTSPIDSKHQLKDTKAKLILLDFWFIGCMPCLNSMPDIERLHNQFSKEGLAVIGINCFDKEEPQSILKKINEMGITYKNYFSDRVLTNMLGVKGYPSVILLTPKGDIIYAGTYSSKYELEDLILKNL